MDAVEMLKMRADGCSLQEIAEKAGVSRQSADQSVKRCAARIANGLQGKKLYVEKIVYQGFYDWFKDNPKESVASLIRKLYGEDSKSSNQKMRYFLTGKVDSYFNIAQIKKMCELVGKPFEEVFKERETE